MTEDRELDLAGRSVNCLIATGIDDGLVLNFRGPSLEFKRKYRTYRSPQAKELVS